MDIVLSILGLVITFYVMAKVIDEYFIVSLDNIAHWLKLSPDVAGATLLAIGTSAPELCISLFALFLPDTNPATGLGSVVGSAIFQILVVIGFASLVRTTYLNWKPVIRDGTFYSVTILLLSWFVWDGVLTQVETGTLLFTYLIYLAVLFSWKHFVPEGDPPEPDPIELIEEDGHITEGSILSKVILIFRPLDWPLKLIPDCEKKKEYTIPVFVTCLLIIAGLSYWMVVSAETLAGAVGISPAIIALTVLAGGSSVPELISSYIVAKQGRGDMAISNAIGSNVFDILVSLGLPLFIYTSMQGNLTDFGGENINSSIFLLFATMLAVMGLLIAQKFRVGKGFGMTLIGTYAAYVVAAYAGWI